MCMVTTTLGAFGSENHPRKFPIGIVTDSQANGGEPGRFFLKMLAKTNSGEPGRFFKNVSKNEWRRMAANGVLARNGRSREKMRGRSAGRKALLGGFYLQDKFFGKMKM